MKGLKLGVVKSADKLEAKSSNAGASSVVDIVEDEDRVSEEGEESEEEEEEITLSFKDLVRCT